MTEEIAKAKHRIASDMAERILPIYSRTETS
jgi:hypothetical protein